MGHRKTMAMLVITRGYQSVPSKEIHQGDCGMTGTAKASNSAVGSLESQRRQRRQRFVTGWMSSWLH